MKILIVDDCVDIQMLLRVQLELVDGVGEVLSAENGAEAVVVASRFQPDLIILDIDMPVMSGDQALPLLRTAAPAAVIAINSATPERMAPGGVSDRADFYLQKLRDDVADFVQTFVRQHDVSGANHPGGTASFAS